VCVIVVNVEDTNMRRGGGFLLVFEKRGEVRRRV
jgi:hypothetical protein